MARLDPTGVSRILTYIKTWITGLLNDKANSSHSHTKSQITDFPTIPSKTSQLTNDSGFLTAHQSLSNYSTLANTVKSLSISGKTITVTPGSGSAYTLTTQDTVYTHPTTAGNKHIPSGGSANQYLKYSENGTAVWAALPTIPTNTNQLTNGAGFITSSGSCNYANYSGYVQGDKSTGLYVESVKYGKALVTTNQSGFGAIFNAPTKNYRIGCATYPNNDDALLFYSVTNANVSSSTNTVNKSMSWNGGTGILTATGFSGPLTGNVTGNCSGSSGSCTGNAANVTGTVAIAHGGTGATTRLSAVQNLTNENVGTSTEYFLTITTNWGKAGYCSVANAKSVLGVPTNTNQLTNGAGFITSSGSCNYANSAGSVAWGNVSGRPTVNNATLTIQKNGSNVATFTSNASSNVTANISVPTKVSQLTNDSGFITSNVSTLEMKGNPPYIDFHASNDTTHDYTSRIIDDGTTNTGRLRITAYANSAHYQVEMYKNFFEPVTDNEIYLGDSTNRWKNIFGATGSISTSDQRVKNNIENIDDSLLDAWSNVQPKQYKFNDAIEEKGDSARYHTGYLAQDIQKACEDSKISIDHYGLFCHDSWEAQEEVAEDIESEVDGKKITEKRIIQPKRDKGDLYSLRYEELLVVECAYLRREVKRLSERLEKLEK